MYVYVYYVHSISCTCVSVSDWLTADSDVFMCMISWMIVIRPPCEITDQLAICTQNCFSTRFYTPYYRQTCAAMLVLFLLNGPKMGFSPAGVHCPHIRGPLSRAKFHVYRGENVGIQPPTLSKFRILARNLYLRGDSFAIFLRNSQYLYPSIGSF